LKEITSVLARLKPNNRESILVQIYEKLKAQKGVTQEKIFLQLRRHFLTDEIDDSIDSGAIDLEKPDDWDAFDREIFAKFKEAKAKPSASRKRKSADASDAEQEEVAEEDETDTLKLFGKAVMYGEPFNLTFTLRNNTLVLLGEVELPVKRKDYVLLKEAYEKIQELHKTTARKDLLREQAQAEEDKEPELEESAINLFAKFKLSVKTVEEEDNEPAPVEDEEPAPMEVGEEAGEGDEAGEDEEPGFVVDESEE